MRVGDDTENTTAFALDCFGHALPVSTAVLFKGLQVSAIGTAGFFCLSCLWEKQSHPPSEWSFIQYQVSGRISTAGEAKEIQTSSPISSVSQNVHPIVA
jgi:hypothetical protein